MAFVYVAQRLNGAQNVLSDSITIVSHSVPRAEGHSISGRKPSCGGLGEKSQGNPGLQRPFRALE